MHSLLHTRPFALNVRSCVRRVGVAKAADLREQVHLALVEKLKDELDTLSPWKATMTVAKVSYRIGREKGIQS